MKIIAEIGKDKFLVEATDKELNNIQGFRHYSDEAKTGYINSRRSESLVDREISISELWEVVQLIHSKGKLMFDAISHAMTSLEGGRGILERAMNKFAPVVDDKKSKGK